MGQQPNYFLNPFSQGWVNPRIGGTLVDDKGKVCIIRQVREEGLVMLLGYQKPHWKGIYRVWVRRSGLSQIDWKPILYGNCTSLASLRMKQRPVLKNLKSLIDVQALEVKRARPKRMIQI